MFDVDVIVPSMQDHSRFGRNTADRKPFSRGTRASRSEGMSPAPPALNSL